MKTSSYAYKPEYCSVARLAPEQLSELVYYWMFFIIYGKAAPIMIAYGKEGAPWQTKND